MIVPVPSPDDQHGPPGLLDELVANLRGAWWIYVIVPVVLTIFSVRGWGADSGVALNLLVNVCAALGIGTTTQLVFVVAQRRRWTLPYGLHNPVLVLVGVGLGTEVTVLILRGLAGFEGLRLRPGLWLIGGIVAAIVATISITYDRLLVRVREGELREEQALRQALQAKLDALQSRMNPHFLFNCLNTVAALIEEDPAAAVIAVERLSELLRHTLERGGERLVPLADELRCAREYLELERARFGDRLCVELELEPNLDGLQVPPLVVQPLVENAVKHGVALSRTPVTIALKVRRAGRSVFVEVCDDGPGSALESRGTGTAQRTLADRLRLIYGDAARFEAGPLAAGGYRASLVIPQEAA